MPISNHYPQLKEKYKFWGRHFVAPFLYSLQYRFTQKILKLWTVDFKCCFFVEILKIRKNVISIVYNMNVIIEKIKICAKTLDTFQKYGKIILNIRI